MKRGHLSKFVNQTQNIAFILFAIQSLIAVGAWIAVELYITSDTLLQVGITASVVMVTSLITGTKIISYSTEPTRKIAQAVYYLDPGSKTAAPDIEKIKIARDFTQGLIRQIYSLNHQPVVQKNLSHHLLDSINVPIIGLDHNNNISYLNKAAKRLGDLDQNGSFTQPFHELFNVEHSRDILKIAEQERDKLVTSGLLKKIGLSGKNSSQYTYYDIYINYPLQEDEVDKLLVCYDQHETYVDQEDSFGFVSLAVHELRTPLTIIRGFAEVLNEETEDNKELHAHVTKLRASVDSLSFFVSNILHVARFDKQKVSISTSKTNWNQLVEEAIKSMHARASSHGKTINLVAEDEFFAKAEPTTINEVLVNLLDNAIKYSMNNTEPIEVKIATSGNGMIETTVSDKGEGIPSSVMPYIFDKFSRNHRNKSRVAGTGLGLYIAKSIVNAHGGTISARSQEGKGSEFMFTLPLYDESSATNPTEPAIIRGSHGWIKNHTLNRN